MEEEYDQEEFIIRKRLPPRYSCKKNDVYVSRKTNFLAQMRRCEKLLENGQQEINIHGLGHAITRAINIALQLQAKSSGCLKVSATTDTIHMVDDLLPVDFNSKMDTQSRNVSVINIRVYRDLPLVTTSTSKESEKCWDNKSQKHRAKKQRIFKNK